MNYGINLNHLDRIRTRFCYSASDNSLLASEDAYKSYVSSCQFDNVAPTQPSVFGRHLVDAIPNVKKIKKRIPGIKNKYKYYYKHLAVNEQVEESDCFKENIPLSKNKMVNTTKMFESSLQYLCDNVESFLQKSAGPCNSSESQWSMLFKNNDVFEIGKYNNPNRDCKLFTRIRVHADMNWNIILGDRLLDSNNLHDIGIQTNKILCVDDIAHLMSIADNLRLCSGVTCTSYEDLPKLTKDINGTVVGKYEENAVISPTGLIHSSCRRSISCTGVLRQGTFASVCPSCSKLRKHLSSQHSKLKKNKQQATTSLQGNSSSKVNKRFLTNEQLHEREDDQKRRRKNAEKREIYWRAKAVEEKRMRKIAEQDNRDLLIMFETLDKEENTSFPDNPEMAMFWEMQKDVISKSDNKGQIRWHPLIIKTCLAIWHRSKNAYRVLEESGFIKLPSKRLLQYHKSKIKQRPGTNKEMLSLMHQMAQDSKLPPAGYCGTILFDEMSIQDDVQLRRNGDSFEIVGIVNLGEVYNNIKALQTGEDRTEIASHILQFMFVGSTGFKFPCCYFPTVEVDPVTLYHAFWDVVFDLHEYGFEVVLCVCDGAEANRSFIKYHFEEDAVKDNFTTTNFYTGEPMIFMVDPSHNFKKLRNNLMKSTTTGKSPRNFQLCGYNILWSHLKDAFIYDVENNPIATFKFLTPDHFEPNSAGKMRNYLADDVLGKRMLEVLQNYKRHLEKEEKRPVTFLDKTIQFIQTTSTLLKNFKAKAPYRSLEDPRLFENESCMEWIITWEDDVKSLSQLKPVERNKRFLSWKTKFDVMSMILGFKSYCKTLFSKFPGSQAHVLLSNQDPLENFFGEQRAQNGQADNPTILQTEHATPAIIQMKNNIIHKGNCMSVNIPKVIRC